MLFTIASASKGERYISQELIISILYLPTSHFPRRDQKLNTYDKQQVPDCATASREYVACNIIFHFYQKAERKGLLFTATDWSRKRIALRTARSLTGGQKVVKFLSKGSLCSRLTRRCEEELVFGCGCIMAQCDVLDGTRQVLML